LREPLMAARLWVPEVSGPLARYAAGYGSSLAARGYSRWAVARRLWQLDLLSRWLERQRLEPGELTVEHVQEFVRARRAAGYSSWVSVRSTTLPLWYVRELGVVPSETVPGRLDDPLERVLAGYCRYLLEECGLTERTVFGRYEPAARLFLTSRVGPDASGLDRLAGADVSLFLAAECPTRSVSVARDMTCALRSLLRYLYLSGTIPNPLVWAVPAIADLRDRSLPRGLDRAAVKRLLASCDRRRTVGRRDYAILLLLLRLGLRAGEVAAITLDDIDWRAGELLVGNGKGKREESLPLPADVGEAIVSYLRRRPRTEDRALFLRALAPTGAIRGSAVTAVMVTACKRAGVPVVGAHALRYTAATEMLRAGASLQEIGEVLRHKDERTTARYAKVDRKTLRRLAQPWPEGGTA
jgi:integrase/recombinase XerD